MKRYTIPEVLRLIKELDNIFDLTRIVNPTNTTVIEFDENSNPIASPQPCHELWSNSLRCENCTSQKAIQTHTRYTKYEFQNSEIFSVISQPFALIYKDGSEHSCILEIVSAVTDEVLFQTSSRPQFKAAITEAQKNLYIDSLTKAHNHRYYDQMIFLSHHIETVPQEVSLVFCDVNNLKDINIEFGREIGDQVLKSVVTTLTDIIDPSASVIRMGGDEFLITLPNCSLEAARQQAAVFKQEIAHLTFSDCAGLTVTIATGISHDVNRVFSKEDIDRLLVSADQELYENKRIQRTLRA